MRTLAAPRALALSLLVACAFPTPALARGAVGAPADPGYEARQAHRVLLQTGLLPHPDPIGKTVAFVRVVREEVFLPNEPFPTALNALHVVTRESIVMREVLLLPGDLFEPDRLLESARNLRSLGIFSMVVALPVQARTPDEVGILIITRDLWSLRLETGYQFTGSQIDELLIQITERNLAGRNQRASARFALFPVTWRLGESFSDYRLFGERLALFQSTDVIFRREDNGYDGVVSELQLGRPFYHLRQRWGFSADVAVDWRNRRQIQQGQVLLWDDPETDEEERVRRAWGQRFIGGTVAAQHQLPGWLTQRFALGFGASSLVVEPIDETGLDPANAESFERRVLPLARQQVFPVVHWSLFRTRFRTYQDLASYGISEDAQLGFSAGGSLHTPLAALGSDTDAAVLGGYVRWTEDFAGDGIGELAVGAESRHERGAWIDNRLLLRGRAATPRFGLGRLVARADYLARREDTARPAVTLGGDNGLRGYPSQALIGIGADRLRTNLEWRSPPWVWSYLHGGLVLFYDAGSVHDRLAEAQLKQSVGLGLRVLIPQFDRSVNRLDVGFPTDGTGFMVTFSAGSAQAVPLTPREDAFYLNSIGGLRDQP